VGKGAEWVGDVDIRAGSLTGEALWLIVYLLPPPPPPPAVAMDGAACHDGLVNETPANLSPGNAKAPLSFIVFIGGVFPVRGRRGKGGGGEVLGVNWADDAGLSDDESRACMGTPPDEPAPELPTDEFMLELVPELVVEPGLEFELPDDEWWRRLAILGSSRNDVIPADDSGAAAPLPAPPTNPFISSGCDAPPWFGKLSSSIMSERGGSCCRAPVTSAIGFGISLSELARMRASRDRGPLTSGIADSGA
jgi:hypothetical protein